MSVQEKPTVLVDMDGVGADFAGQVLQTLTDRYPDFVPLAERKNFYIGDDHPDYKDIVMDIIREPGFFRNLPVIEGFLEGWQRIMDAGYSPRICSSPILNHPTCPAEKKDWLAKHFVPEFGAWVVETAIITREKHLYDGIALIDDRPGIQTPTARWQHIMFDQPYNKALEVPHRLVGWQAENLEAMLDECNELYQQQSPLVQA